MVIKYVVVVFVVVVGGGGVNYPLANESSKY